MSAGQVRVYLAAAALGIPPDAIDALVAECHRSFANRAHARGNRFIYSQGAL